MNVVPIRPQSAAERHVQFSEYVEVQHIRPTETTTVEPSMYAQRLQRQLREAPIRPPEIARETPAPAQTCKNLLHTMSMVCGALFLPSFAFLFLGPIGLVVPAALITAAVACVLLGGKPTEAMLQARAARRAEMQEYDPR